MITDELLAAYQSTEYRITDPPIIIRIGEINPHLEELLTLHKCEDWAYITSWNPHSKTISEIENNLRHDHLTKDLQGYKLFEGWGVGQDPTWSPERSLLVLGIKRENAIDIGRKYEQNAIVVGKKVGKPLLLLMKQ